MRKEFNISERIAIAIILICFFALIFLIMFDKFTSSSDKIEFCKNNNLNYTMGDNYCYRIIENTIIKYPFQYKGSKLYFVIEQGEEE